ncbi:MAG: hypothetical protein WC619_01535 [Patescibacteria group bacterium]
MCGLCGLCLGTFFGLLVWGFFTLISDFTFCPFLGLMSGIAVGITFVEARNKKEVVCWMLGAVVGMIAVIFGAILFLPFTVSFTIGAIITVVVAIILGAKL